MKRIHFVKLLFVAVFACGSLNAWGADVTLTTADYTWSASDNEVSQTIDGEPLPGVVEMPQVTLPRVYELLDMVPDFGKVPT